MKRWCFFILMILSTSAYSQYTVKHVTNADGLSNHSINCIYEDRELILWFGTWDGLNAYNGREIKSYRYKIGDSLSICNNIIRVIAEQNKDYLWIASDVGLNRWDRKKDIFNRFFEEEIGPMLAVANETVICGIREKGLFYFDTSRQEFIKIKSGIDLNGIKKIGIDSLNNLYLLSSQGDLIKLPLMGRNGKISGSGSPALVQAHPVLDMEVRQDKLVLNCRDSVKIIDLHTLRSDVVTFNGRQVSNMALGNRNLYVRQEGGGYVAYDMSRRTLSPVDLNLQGVSVFSMFAGSQDILWIGTDGQGAIEAYESTSAFRTVKANCPVRCFSEDANGDLLIGTKGEGIQKISLKTGKIIKSFTLKDGLKSNSVYALKKNNSGDVFIGSDGEGLAYISSRGDQVKRLKIPLRYPAFSSVYSILFTQNDTKIWLGSASAGFIRIEVKKRNGEYLVENVEQYTTSSSPYSITHNTIYSVVKGADENEIWFGMRGGGINKYIVASGRIDPMPVLNQNLMNRDILSLLFKAPNTLLSGTSYGLTQVTFSGNDFSVTDFTDSTGIANNTIHGVLFDKKENLWISTNYGLSHIDRKSRQVTNYTTQNGLHNNEFSDGAYYADSKGSLFFGGVDGFTYFNPEEIHLRDYSPPIRLLNLRINNERKNVYDRIANGELRLSYDESYLTFSFLAQDYINNENCKFSYRILNFAEEWIHNENNPNIILTKLPPGDYQLAVKCTNGDGVWGNYIYQLNIHISPPWWSSPFAYVVYFLLCFLTGYFIYTVIRNRLRLKRQILFDQIERQQQQKVHESKLNFFTNVAHEFLTPLTLIYGPAQYLLEKNDLNSHSKRYIQLIKNNADRMQKLLHELMEFRKAESGHLALHAERIDLKLFLEYICDGYAEIAEEKKIDFQLFTEGLSDFVSDRNSLETIYLNLISNAFKYTPEGGYIHLFLQQKGEQLSFRIQNSGKGLTHSQMAKIFDRFQVFETSKLEKAKSTGIGLGLAKSLVELLGGVITVDSVIDKQVEFTVLLKEMQIEEEESENSEWGVSANYKPKEASGKRISILIVEDEKNIREFLKDILLPYYEVSEAEDGKQGLELIRYNMPDMVLTDTLMSRMDGMELIEALKSNALTSHIPIISISAKNAIEDHITAYRQGADLYIAKPFHPQHVLTAVENIIAKYQLLKAYFNSSRSSIVRKEGLTLHQEDDQFLQKIIAYIESNVDDESLNPNTISDFLSISRASFFRKLKDLTHKTPSEFIRSIRLEYASKLLRTTKLTVSEIMFKSGFSHKSYFYREFAKQFGVSPKEYREKNQL